jgi:hypothetical protein
MRAGRQLLVFGGLGLAAGLGGLVAGVYGWRTLNATATIHGAAEAGCDLQRGSCRAHFPDGGEMILSITPRPIPLLKPIEVNIELRNLPAGNVAVDVSSPDMNMGYNRRELAAHDGQRYRGHTVLPVCILKRMRWELRAIAHQGNTRHEAVFGFVTETRRQGEPG